MKTIVITGASGFIGANLVSYGLSKGYSIHCLLRQTSKNWRLTKFADHIELHKVSLLDEKKLTTILKSIKPDWIFHTAVYGAYPQQLDFKEMIQTNICSTDSLLRACAHIGVESFVNTGSSSEYGFKNHRSKEDEILEPNSYYAITKAAQTHTCAVLANQHQLYAPTLRLYSVYGPFEEPTRLFPTLLLKAMKKEFPPLADPSIARDFVFVEDVVRAFYMVAKKNKSSQCSPIYNIGSGKQTTLKDLVKLVAKEFGIDTKPEWSSMQDRIWDTHTWVANTSKAKTELLWQPKTDLHSGVKRTSAWLKEHLQWYT